MVFHNSYTITFTFYRDRHCMVSVLTRGVLGSSSAAAEAAAVAATSNSMSRQADSR